MVALDVESLDAALEAAFPDTPIDRAMIDEPTANWSVYDDHADLSALEGKSWREVAAVLARHPTLPVYAGDMLFRAVLPGYLRNVLRQPAHVGELPFQLARQLTRPDDTAARARFERRSAGLSLAQRTVVRDVLARLATIPPIDEVMARALESWTQ